MFNVILLHSIFYDLNVTLLTYEAVTFERLFKSITFFDIQYEDVFMTFYHSFYILYFHLLEKILIFWLTSQIFLKRLYSSSSDMTFFDIRYEFFKIHYYDFLNHYLDILWLFWLTLRKFFRHTIIWLFITVFVILYYYFLNILYSDFPWHFILWIIFYFFDILYCDFLVILYWDFVISLSTYYGMTFFNSYAILWLYLIFLRYTIQ